MFEAESPGQPTIGSRSPSSTAASRMVSKSSVTGGIYSHWFALKLYDIMTTLQVSNTGPTTITFVDNKFQIKRDSIERIVKCVKSIFSLPKYASKQFGRGMLCDPSLQCSKLTLTALLARELDRFLFPDPSVGACLHQFPVHVGPSSGTPERADIYFAKYNSNNLPANPICAADFKKDSMENAVKESTAYSIRLMETRHITESYIMCLNIPSTCSEMSFQLHLGLKDHIMVIDICTVAVRGNDAQLQKYFCMLYAAVHHVIVDGIQYSKPCVSPTRSLCLAAPLTTSPFRVFVVDGYVYKLYDTTSDIPNFELVEKILPEAKASLIYLSEDKRFQMLKYTYLKGDHKMRKKSQYAHILQQLHKIHEIGYVHSDIRDINIVFSKCSDEAWIIDFDIAGTEGSIYPDNYNHSEIFERHDSARAGKPRKKVHDRYALSVLMKKDKLQADFITQVEGDEFSLNDIADNITKQYHK